MLNRLVIDGVGYELVKMDSDRYVIDTFQSHSYQNITNCISIYPHADKYRHTYEGLKIGRQYYGLIPESWGALIVEENK